MSLVDKTKLPYRKAVTGFVIDKSKNFLLIQNMRYKKNHWRSPGGGIEKGENPKGALLRELKEELGTDKFEVISKSKIAVKYDWPEGVIKRYKNEWRGQKRTQFLVKFTGRKRDIKINKEEIKNAKWVSLDELHEYLNFPGQSENMKKVIAEFNL